MSPLEDRQCVTMTLVPERRRDEPWRQVQEWAQIINRVDLCSFEMRHVLFFINVLYFLSWPAGGRACNHFHFMILTFVSPMLSDSDTWYVRSVSSNPVALMRWSVDGSERGGESGELRHVWIKALPVSLVIMGWSLRVAKVYTWPVSLATSSRTWVPVRVESS